MLPELLFSVGSSMQDISREDFGLLNGGCDKDTAVIAGNDPTLERIKLGRTPDLEAVSIKLEEPADIYPWHTTTDIGSNLLRHSDDPLISGAIDDNQNEFSPITRCDTSKKQQKSSSTKAPEKKATRTRRKGQFKLRFHHQALPQEYLEHYEAAQNILQKKKTESTPAATNKQTTSSAAKLNQGSSMTSPGDQQNVARSHESVRNWLQKISEYQGEAIPPVQIKHEPEISISPTMPSPVAKKPSRVVSYSDLPYMGEMTLDNSKPRRGRKPKKADICHLIYKNYGTILPGTPKDLMEISGDKTGLEADMKKTDIQSKIISSLLEKRLTQDSKRLSPANLDPEKGEVKKQQAEPLNLCVRDHSDVLTLSSGGETDTESLVESARTSPLIPPSDTDNLLAANLKMALPNFQSALLEQPPVITEIPTATDGKPSSGASGNYVYWPGAGVFIHPMAMYYQKMVDAGATVIPVSSSATSSEPTTSSASVLNETTSPSPLPTSSTSSPPIKKEATGKMLIPKNISQLIKQEKPTSVSPAPVLPPRAPSEASSTSSKSTTPAPQKRKRSAIFIPPMPQDTSSSHATEVSICKFKFTGGAKPSLQEKKMLSVDSGGNFRYYSGTGDKSMRGYEFFPRESLQQSSLLTGSSSGAFLNTPGEKIPMDIAPPSHGLSNELLQIPEIALSPVNAPNNAPSSSVQRSGHSSERRKRKSRRSLQREKLEKTFKEKGFLIQTQQLESAEGATYCKFRQLRKFTRYLFRSWKDYLPGELQQQGAQGAIEVPGGVAIPGGSKPAGALSLALAPAGSTTDTSHTPMDS